MDLDDEDYVEVAPTVSNVSKKRQRSIETEDPDPSPKRATRSSSRLNLKAQPSPAISLSPSSSQEAPIIVDEIDLRSSSSPAVLTEPLTLKLRITSKLTLKTPTIKPTPLDKLNRGQNNAKPVSSTSWASLLDRKGLSPPKSKTTSSSSSPPPANENGAGKTTVSLNPYAAAPGDPVHPFFMSSEARREHNIKDNKQKLQAALAKRQEEIRAQNKTTPGLISAFFAPRPKPTPSSTTLAANPESRLKWAGYGSDLPDFPSLTRVEPLSEPSPSLISNISHLNLFEMDEEDEEPIGSAHGDIQFSSLSALYQSRYGLNFESESDERARISDLVSSKPRTEAPGDEEIKTISKHLYEAHLAIRKRLGMSLGPEAPITRKKSAIELVPLLDVKAEDMASHLALQQQAVAQRQVAEEEALIAATFFNPPYTELEIAELYRVMIQQNLDDALLPWSACFAPTRAHHVCGNRDVANAVKDWLTQWQEATETLNTTAPPKFDFFKRNDSNGAAKTTDSAKRSDVTSPGTKNADPLKKRISSPVLPSSSDQSSLPGNPMVLVGPTGCGKTSALYATAKELNFEVLEVNASMKRSGAGLKTMIEEATQSRHLGRASRGITILLFEEVDQQFEDDAGFLPALVSICESAKRPIVLTCHELPKLLQAKLPKLVVKEMRSPDEASLFVHASLACLTSGLSLPSPSLIHQFSLWFNADLRSIFNNLQYWSSLLHHLNWKFAIRALSGLPLPSHYGHFVTRQDESMNCEPSASDSLLLADATAHNLQASELDVVGKDHSGSNANGQEETMGLESSSPPTQTLGSQASHLTMPNGDSDSQPMIGSPRMRQTSTTFLASESTDLPNPLDLLHRIYLPSLVSSERKMEAVIMNEAKEDGPSLLRQASLFSDSLALADTWHTLPNLDDEVDTQHELAQEMRAYLQLISFLTKPDWHGCPSDEERYSVGQKRQQEATRELVESVSNTMIIKSGSRLSQFDDYCHLALIACLEDQQRLLNSRRRQYKSKTDWSRIKPAKRLLFIRALRLSEVPPPS